MKNQRLFIHLLLLSCTCFFTNLSFATEKVDLISVETFTLKSSVLNEYRGFSVYLPGDYNTGANHYVVLYILDGRAHITHAIAATNFLSGRQLTPPMIVVAIHNVDRNRDFSPVKTENFPNNGGAHKFLNFVSDELIPYVNAQYRTSDFNILMGHSFGGEFATYALLNKPEVFDGYIAISPYLQYADNYLIEASESMLRSSFNNTKYFYMTVGNEPDYFPVLEEFASHVKEKSNEAIAFQYVKMENEDHRSIPYISLFNGLRFIFSDWQLPQEMYNKDLASIDAHYKMISARYGFEIETPENVINLLGYRYLQNNDTETAIKVFRVNIKRYPGSANVYDSLGEAYENNNQLKLAKENYQKAYDQGIMMNDPNTAIYKRNLDRMTEM